MHIGKGAKNKDLVQVKNMSGYLLDTELHPSGSGSRRREERGLSELVMYCTGKPLDKWEQCSEWLRRPLRQNQVNYAGISMAA